MLHFDTNSFHIWPANESFDDNVHIILPIGERCKCSYRIDFDVQCKHELKVDPRFKLEHWSHRWLTRKQFNIRHPDLMCFQIGNMTQLNIREERTEQANVDNQDINGNVTQNSAIIQRAKFSTQGQSYSTDFATNNIGDTLIEDKNSDIRYKDLVDCCSELCRNVSNDKDMSRSVYSTVHEWVSKLRQGDAFEIKFTNTVRGICTQKQNDITPNAATITPCLHAQQQNRFKSRSEVSKHIGNIPVRDKSLSVYDVDYEPTILNFSNLPLKIK